MIRPLLIAAALVATPVYAGDIADNRYRIEAEQTRKAAMRWEATFLALSTIDLIQTVSCLEGKSCTEGNPVWGSNPKTSHLIIGKIIGGAVHFYAVDRISRRNPKAALRIAQFSVAVQGGVVGLNFRGEF